MGYCITWADVAVIKLVKKGIDFVSQCLLIFKFFPLRYVKVRTYVCFEVFNTYIGGFYGESQLSKSMEFR